MLGGLISFTGCQFKFNQIFSPTTPAKPTAVATNTAAEQAVSKEDYQQVLIKLMTKDLLKTINQEFSSQSEGAIIEQQKALVTAVKVELLSLTVPVDYQDLHLSLVLGFDEIQTADELILQALNQDINSLDQKQQLILEAQRHYQQGQNKIREKIDQTPWLVKLLTA